MTPSNRRLWVNQTAAFRALHVDGIFVMPNPWDRGSARILQEIGFPALATTSAGHGQAIGKADQEVTREELVRHVAELTSFITVPLNVDSERLFPDDPGGIAETVRLLAEAGAAGCSIEDYQPATKVIDPIDVATDAVAQAVAACAEHGLVLTARAENHLYGIDDIDDTVGRLSAYQEAGAEVLYAPLLSQEPDIAQVVALGKPVNVLALPNGPSIPELGELGVRRISTGSALYNASYATLQTAAQEVHDAGTSTYAKP